MSTGKWLCCVVWVCAYSLAWPDRFFLFCVWVGKKGSGNPSIEIVRQNRQVLTKHWPAGSSRKDASNGQLLTCQAIKLVGTLLPFLQLEGERKLCGACCNDERLKLSDLKLFEASFKQAQVPSNLIAWHVSRVCLFYGPDQNFRVLQVYFTDWTGCL